ncbi:MAG: hypothetical protein DRQ02_01410 [Candidatus Latescibacterota bacterium]|nr:MAG: hypothetical protein DRQ02_01410 [Candidatus Latescibacterota bacterium]
MTNCTHPSSNGDEHGNLICTVCGETVGQMGQPYHFHEEQWNRFQETDHPDPFAIWLDTFLAEKEINIEAHVFCKQGPSGPNYIPLAVVIEFMKLTGQEEQNKIQMMLVKLDFANAPIIPLLDHLAGALAV